MVRGDVHELALRAWTGSCPARPTVRGDRASERSSRPLDDRRVSDLDINASGELPPRDRALRRSHPRDVRDGRRRRRPGARPKRGPPGAGRAAASRRRPRARARARLTRPTASPTRSVQSCRMRPVGKVQAQSPAARCGVGYGRTGSQVRSQPKRRSTGIHDRYLALRPDLGRPCSSFTPRLDLGDT